MDRSFALLVLAIGATAAASDDMTAFIGYARHGEAAMPGAGPAATVAAQEHYASLDWPVRLGERRLVAVGFNYQYTRYDYANISSRDRDLHHLQLPVRFEYVGADRKVSAYLAPGIAASSNVFKDFLNRGSADDWYVSGAIEARFGQPRRQWLFGAAYDRSFGKSRLYPIVGLRISPRNNVDMRLAFPVSGVAWHYSDRGTLTGRAMPAGFAWRVTTDDFDSEFDYRVEGLRTQLHWTHRIGGRWSIDLSAGYESDRRHAFVDNLDERVVGHPQGEWLFALTLGLGRATPALPHGVRLQSITN